LSKKNDPKDNTTREIVKKFCNYVVHLKAIHQIYRELFANDEGRRLMEQTSKSFFMDINKILIIYLMSEIAKITDRAKTFNKYENFTIANILETIDWPASVLCELNRLNNIVVNFRGNITEARNKLLAHYDKNTFISGTILGAFPEGDDEKLIETLEEMCNVLHKASFGEIFGDISVTMVGDVLDLKKALKRSIAFDKLFKESKGEELSRLSYYLKD